jgi:hypothetical protein
MKPPPEIKLKPGTEREYAQLCKHITNLAAETMPDWEKLKSAVDRRNELIDTTGQ